MKIAMQICAHRHVRQYDEFGTCLTCYQRLRTDDTTQKWEPDAPVTFLCDHRDKEPILISQMRTLKTYDASCARCGTVLRHPDGPGAWEEVVFSGFIIREEP